MASTDVRDRILAAALHIVGTDGIPGVTNRRIAAQAGVSLGSITYHFPTQTDLLRAALSGFVTEETQRLSDLAEGYRDKGLSLEDAAALTGKVAKDLAFSAERIAPFELYIQAGRDHELRQAAAECFAAYDDLTVTILTALGVPDAASVAPTIVATIAGLQLRRLATGSDGDQDFATSVLLLLRAAGPVSG
ncbi:MULTISPECIES: TetR/AcrR family transcriptional regulator [Rhodococcus]|uniref:Transcriptional regulator n=1 Tax=Rhodococcus opacus RKJ300 = JCM 13270 TaxID=1165867 RepID=I0WLA3_RHOOP|nr:MULTISPECIES: TetR/AcrR family transcriptional regulator [Rhodococcus]EID77169.1 transcriptional regulator [Rhodococcus opacus RKJ300 = JCM 13270]QQZ16137.1 TetR family transcriptional regulator [Rhodococcus sp. 21391]